MSQPFSFPPPPPPPPTKREVPTQEFRGSFRGRGSNRGNHSRGFSPAYRGRGSRGSQTGLGGRRDTYHRPSTTAPKRDFSTAFANHNQDTIENPSATLVSKVNTENVPPKGSTVSSATGVAKKSNLLGLTPVLNEVSDSDDNDEDEESKLAAVSLNGGIHFEHRGHQLSLNTPAEIAAWIAERRKRFPTKAKADAAKQEARKHQLEREAEKRAREEAQKLKREIRDKERTERERQRIKDKAITAQIARAKSAVANTHKDTALEAKVNAEKLKRKAERAAKELQIAEQRLYELEEGTVHVDKLAGSKGKENDPSVSDVSDLSDSDKTSSSGSSDSDSDSEGASDAAPEESTSKGVAPDPKFALQQSSIRTKADGPPLCKNLAKFGRCKFGRKCRFSHRLPKKESKQQPNLSTRRKGLYQIMVEKEEEAEMRAALRMIIALGEQGKLNEPQDSGHAVDPSKAAS